MLTKEERLEKERQKQEQKELKIKSKEFVKKIFSYDLSKKKLSEEIKEELSKLGAFKPFYSDIETERAILYIDMWKSDKKEVKNIILNESRQDFPKFSSIDLENLLEKAHQDLLIKRQRAKEMRKGK